MTRGPGAQYLALLWRWRSPHFQSMTGAGFGQQCSLVDTLRADQQPITVELDWGKRQRHPAPPRRAVHCAAWRQVASHT